MTREDVIRMYEKANGWNVKEYEKTVDELERFAKLVAAAERENICKQIAALHDSISLASDAVIKVRGKP